MILDAYLTQIRDASVTYIDVLGALARNKNLSQSCQRARDEIKTLSQEYHEMLGKVSADEFQEDLIKFRADVNRIARSAGLKEIWGKA